MNLLLKYIIQILVIFLILINADTDETNYLYRNPNRRNICYECLPGYILNEDTNSCIKSKCESFLFKNLQN